MLCEACISVSNEALRKWHLKVLYNITHVQNDALSQNIYSLKRCTN